MNRRQLLAILPACLTAGLGCQPQSVFTEYECFLCKGAGTIRCTGCFGKGTTAKFQGGIHSMRTERCWTCSGSGKAKCHTCKGTGKLSNNPLKG